MKDNAYTYTKVWKANGRLIVADTIIEAIEIYRMFSDGEDPNFITRVYGDNWIDEALIKY